MNLMEHNSKSRNPNVVTFIEILSAMPSTSRKKRMKKMKFSHENGEESLINKFLDVFCGYSGKMAKEILKKQHSQCKRK
ncbi:MAG: hypothetical protein J6U58_05480 [Bacteroidaceae bacterium]|nr:hypothetical protein [Bacteroidaceae bacterium]